MGAGGVQAGSILGGGSGWRGKSRLYALQGVDFASGLAMGKAETGRGYCQFGASGFALATGQETQHCGLFPLWRLGKGGVGAGYFLGHGPVIGLSLYWRCWAVWMLLAG